MTSTRHFLLSVGLGLASMLVSARAEEPKPVHGNHRPELDAVVEGMKKDCAADVEKFCKKPAPAKAAGGRHGPHGCLHENVAKLSPACRAHVEEMDAHHPHPNPKDLEKPAAPTPEATRTSLEMESSDLAYAVLQARGIRVGETMSPTERTIALASAATMTVETPVNEVGIESAPVPSKVTDGKATESL